LKLLCTFAFALHCKNVFDPYTYTF